MVQTQIHETVVRDVIDILTDVKKSDEVQMIKNRDKSFKSIATASSGLTLVFPVVASRTISIENASMISKAIERKAVSMLQMLFSAIAVSSTPNGFDYLKKFHTNLDLDGQLSVDSFIGTMDKLVDESVITILDRKTYETVKEDMRNINYTLPDNISESSIENYKILPGIRNTIIKEADINKIQRAGENAARSKNMIDALKGGTDIYKNQLLDSDVKKCNELVPTMMVVNFCADVEGTPVFDNMVIGVKAKLYPVDSMDMINRIKLKNQDNNGLLKFIKATTREISFMRDFLFAIDKAKIDALSQSRRGSSSKLWKVLERRALKSKIRRTLSSTNDASAITTMVISQEEVEYLKKNENINVEDPSVIRPIFEAYNCMGFCIVDENMEVAKFIFDTGEDVYENMSFSHLERESSDNSTKKIINLMTKLSR